MTRLSDVPAYSVASHKHYSNWESLVHHEANGWIVCVVITESTPKRSRTWPWMVGPFADKADAERERRRLRSRWKREQSDHPHQTYKFFVRPAWISDQELRGEG